MLELAAFDVFAALDEAGLAQLRASVERRLARSGQVLMRRGATGRALLAVGSGGLAVEATPGDPPVFVGPGQVVGEMSLVSGLPVSATVRAARDSELWVLPAAGFAALLESQIGLQARVTELLVRRLRSSQNELHLMAGPQVALVTLPEDAALADRYTDALHRAVLLYLPGTERLAPGDARSAKAEVDGWRAGAATGELLLVALPADEVPRLSTVLEGHDAVLSYDDRGDPDDTLAMARRGPANQACVRLALSGRAGPEQRWAHRLDPAELTRCADGAPPTRARAPHLDRLARWLARKQVGLALSAGAALGFAHMGVLAELRRLGLPIDCLAGTSMGGVAALMYGLAGEGQGAIEKAVWTLGRPGSRRVSWLPRGSLLSDRELRRRGETIAEGRCLADLAVPVSVVSSDLVRGERVVIDRGRVADAFFSTSSVPGVLPPVFERDRVLVDGALMSRLPLDLLPRSRCALRIAVNVIPAPEAEGDAAQRAQELRRLLGRPFGFVRALSRSWDLLGWWHGARDAADADVLLEPATRDHSGLEFAKAWPGLVEAGREVVRAHADELLAAARGLTDEEPPADVPPVPSLP